MQIMFDDYSGEIVKVDFREFKPVKVQRASASRGGGSGGCAGGRDNTSPFDSPRQR